MKITLKHSEAEPNDLGAHLLPNIANNAKINKRNDISLHDHDVSSMWICMEQPMLKNLGKYAIDKPLDHQLLVQSLCLGNVPNLNAVNKLHGDYFGCCLRPIHLRDLDIVLSCKIFRKQVNIPCFLQKIKLVMNGLLKFLYN